MEKIFNFYVLVSSKNEDEIRYVGTTTRTIKQRFYGHKYCCNHKENEVYLYINECILRYNLDMK